MRISVRKCPSTKMLTRGFGAFNFGVWARNARQRLCWHACLEHFISVFEQNVCQCFCWCACLSHLTSNFELNACQHLCRCVPYSKKHVNLNDDTHSGPNTEINCPRNTRQQKCWHPFLERIGDRIRSDRIESNRIESDPIWSNQTETFRIESDPNHCVPYPSMILKSL